MTSSEKRPVRAKRADAQWNEKVLLDAAAAVFGASGVDAPVRENAAKAGVRMGDDLSSSPVDAERGALTQRDRGRSFGMAPILEEHCCGNSESGLPEEPASKSISQMSPTTGTGDTPEARSEDLASGPTCGRYRTRTCDPYRVEVVL